MWHSLNLFIISQHLAVKSAHQPGRSEAGWGMLHPQVITFPEQKTLKRAVKTDLLFYLNIIRVTLFFKTHALQKLLVASDGGCASTSREGSRSRDKQGRRGVCF